MHSGVVALLFVVAALFCATVFMCCLRVSKGNYWCGESRQLARERASLDVNASEVKLSIEENVGKLDNLRTQLRQLNNDRERLDIREQDLDFKAQQHSIVIDVDQ